MATSFSYHLSKLYFILCDSIKEGSPSARAGLQRGPSNVWLIVRVISTELPYIVSAFIDYCFNVQKTAIRISV